MNGYQKEILGAYHGVSCLLSTIQSTKQIIEVIRFFFNLYISNNCNAQLSINSSKQQFYQ